MEARNDSIDFLSVLPSEISMQILFWLQAENLARANLVSKQWNVVISTYFSPFIFLQKLQIATDKEIPNLINFYRSTTTYLFTEHHFETTDITAWELLSYAMAAEDIKKIPLLQFEIALNKIKLHAAFSDNLKNSFDIMLIARKIGQPKYYKHEYQQLNESLYNYLNKDRSYVNLSGAYLSEINLSKANLSGINFYNVKLYKANLANVNFKNTNLTQADLRGAKLQEANLVRANLQKARLHSADLYKANFHFADLSHAKMPGAMLIHANLTSANLTAANLAWANLSSTNFSSTILEHTYFFFRLPLFSKDSVFSSLEFFEEQLNPSDAFFENIQLAIARDIVKLIKENYINIELIAEGKKTLELIQANSFFKSPIMPKKFYFFPFSSQSSGVDSIFKEASAEIKEIEKRNKSALAPS